jgi:hypothetical protein
MPKVHLLDYVAGNIRSLVNAIERCGYEFEWIRRPEDVESADVGLCFFSSCFLGFGGGVSCSREWVSGRVGGVSVKEKCCVGDLRGGVQGCWQPETAVGREAVITS